jgi:hypothetical protein
MLKRVNPFGGAELEKAEKGRISKNGALFLVATPIRWKIHLRIVSKQWQES